MDIPDDDVLRVRELGRCKPGLKSAQLEAFQEADMALSVPVFGEVDTDGCLSLIHISEPTRHA